MSEWPSRPVTDFHGRALPEPATPAGYAALIDRFDLRLPTPPRLAGISEKHRRGDFDQWLLLTPRHRPQNTLEAHLVFALKWEGVDLGVLAALFKQIGKDDVAAVILKTPTGAFSRRIWFLYEWLTDDALDVPDPGKVRAVPVVDPRQQVALSQGVSSKRHKVIDNLPGARTFCPMVRWTPALRTAATKAFDQQARDIIGRTRKDLITRAAAFLLLSDSKSSFAIEGERPTSARAARWAQVIGEAGTHVLSIEALERLQRIVIGDARFVTLGVRTEGGFVGTHDRDTQEPVPEHISARPEDLPSLLSGIIDYNTRALTGDVDPVAGAAAMAFGFVYAHPFEDGNGRLHRWLIHHVLATAGYSPPGLPLPVSAAILRQIDAYKRVLESYSAALLSFIEWRATPVGNVEVLNDTANYYRYFDATPHAEFLYACVEQTVERDLPAEVRFLEAFDRFASAVKEIVEMPDRRIEQLRGFLAQENGRLSKRAREGEFSQLSDAEAAAIEALFAMMFNSPAASSPA